MNTSRRTLLAPTLLVQLALAACANTTVTVTPDSIIAVVSSIITGAKGALAQVETAAPSLIPAASQSTIATALSDAASVASALVSGVSATSGASIVQKVEGYINTVLGILDSAPIAGLIPAPFSTAIAAIAFLLPTLETFVTAYLGTSAVSASIATVQTRTRLLAAAPVQITSVAQAQAILATYAEK